VPEHVSGSLHDDVTVQVLRIEFSSWYTSFVLAHSPFDVAAKVPLISGWIMSARAAPTPGPPSAAAATSVAPAIAPIERTEAPQAVCSSRKRLIASGIAFSERENNTGSGYAAG
jgi:hypothetical protein